MFADWKIFQVINGPAGTQLGTGPEDLPRALPSEMAIETGVVAGATSLNPLYSALIEGPNDGKVSVKSALTTPAKSSLVLPVSHTWMPVKSDVVNAVISFIETGFFPDQG